MSVTDASRRRAEPVTSSTPSRAARPAPAPAPGPAAVPGPADPPPSGPGPGPSPPWRATGTCSGWPNSGSMFVANIVSMLGTVVAEVALTVLVYEQTWCPGAGRLGAGPVLPVVTCWAGSCSAGPPTGCPPGAPWSSVTCSVPCWWAAMVIPGMPSPPCLAALREGPAGPGLPGGVVRVLPDVLPLGPGYILGGHKMRMVAESAQIVGYGAGGCGRRALPAACAAFDAASSPPRPRRCGRRGRRPAAGTGPGRGRGRRPAARVPACCPPGVRRPAVQWPTGVRGTPGVAAPYALSGACSGHRLPAHRAPGWDALADLVAAGCSASGGTPSRLSAALLTFVPLAGSRPAGYGPGAGPARGCGVGSAWGAGLDRPTISGPRQQRGRVLALASAGLMFIQGAGFALWGIACQYVPVTVVIPAAAAAGVLVVPLLRPRPPARRRGAADRVTADRPAAGAPAARWLPAPLCPRRRRTRRPRVAGDRSRAR